MLANVGAVAIENYKKTLAPARLPDHKGLEKPADNGVCVVAQLIFRE